MFRALCGIAEVDTPAEVADKARTTCSRPGLDLLETAPYLLHLLDVEDDVERFAALTPEVDEVAHLRDAAPARRQEEPSDAAGHRHRGPALDRQHVRGVSRHARRDCSRGAHPARGCTHRFGLSAAVEREVLHHPGGAAAARPGGEPAHREVGAGRATADEALLRAHRRQGRGQSVLRRGAGADRARAGRARGRRWRCPIRSRKCSAGASIGSPPRTSGCSQIAAVVGKDVSFSVVQAVAGTSRRRDAARRVRRGSQGAEFLYETGTERGDRVHLQAHPDPRGRVRHGCCRSARRDLHVRIVEAIERLLRRTGSTSTSSGWRTTRCTARIWPKAVGYLRRPPARRSRAPPTVRPSRTSSRRSTALARTARGPAARGAGDRPATGSARLALSLGELERSLAVPRARPRALAAALDDQRRLGASRSTLIGRYT